MIEPLTVSLIGLGAIFWAVGYRGFKLGTEWARNLAKIGFMMFASGWAILLTIWFG